MRVAVSEPAVTVEVKDLGRLAAAILGQISLPERPRSAFKLDHRIRLRRKDKDRRTIAGVFEAKEEEFRCPTSILR